MRSFIAAVIIIIIVAVGSVIYTNRVDDISVELLRENDKVVTAVLSGEYEAAEDALAIFEQCLEDNKTLLEAMGNHEELLKIELCCKELTMYIHARQSADALTRCASLDVLLRHLPSNYKLKAENIL